MAKLVVAAASRSRGNCAAASGQYRAFINELAAQSGKSVDQQAASILAEDAAYLIEHCP
jgi:hypothetical protein